jgi:ubiquitin carboxyl-terminal hydrolase L5
MDLFIKLTCSQAFFTTILKDIGVRDLRVHEVFGVDDDALAILPKPVHAVIFLFKYQEDGTAEQVQETKCPDHVWFANQVSHHLQTHLHP